MSRVLRNPGRSRPGGCQPKAASSGRHRITREMTMFFSPRVLQKGVAPSRNFDLSNWKITLPVSSSGSTSGTAVEVKELGGYEHSKFFFTAPDGGMVFVAPVKGARTSGSRYTRSELREMRGTERAAWSAKVGGVLRGELAVNEIPIKTGGEGGRIVIGQIHGQDDELCRLYYDRGALYFINDQSGSTGRERTIHLKSADGAASKIPLDKRFQYSIEVRGGVLSVRAFYDGVLYSATDKVTSHWDDDTFYFKAGAYNGVGAEGSGAGTLGSGTARVTFYNLMFSHAADAFEVKPSPSPEPSPEPAPNDGDTRIARARELLDEARGLLAGL